MKKLFFSLFLILIPSLTLAATLKTGNNITPNRGEKDIYVFSDNISIDNDLSGDAVLFGQNINVSANVEDSLFAFGMTINVKGSVGKNLRLGGSSVSVSGNIGNDVLAAAQTINIEKNAVISGDFWAGASEVTISGEIQGNAKIAASSVTIRGKIGGNVDIEAQKITINDEATIGGSFNYWSQNQANIASGAKITNGPYFNKIQNRHASGVSRFINAIYSLTSLLLLALALTYGFNRQLSTAAREKISDFARNFGWGLFSIAYWPLATIFLLVLFNGAISYIVMALGAIYIEDNGF